MSTLGIPAFAVSDKSKIEGLAEVFIQSRKDISAAGIFEIRIAAHFDPAVDEYPAGNIVIRTDLSDAAKGIFTATSIELINSYGKHNPTIYLTGRCHGDFAVGASTSALPKGLRYWIMFADNKQQAVVAPAAGTPDIAAFAIHDRNGNRIAYGAGPLRSGNITVQPE